MNADQSPKTVLLGNEYDERLRDTLMKVLKSLGGTSEDASYGVGGSQEVEALEVSFGADTILVEAETYVGLTVSGKAGLVDRIVALVRASTASS
jgi:hypothetical protein